MTDTSICLKPIADLLANEDGTPTQFWIPAYQRGFRWKTLQVTQLLDDVWDFIQTSEGGDREAFYCLQPLVIKVHEDGRYEVVDGQQRLTTIYILLTYLSDIATMLGKSRFKITFDTRGEANEPFLENIDLDLAEENVDFYHICEAYKAIEDWFSQRDGMHKLKLLQHFLNDDESGRNVKVIWFQLSDNDNSVAAFTRLNVGKIPLTNDELIRALFLRRTVAGETADEDLQRLIANEWDQIEKSLQADDFWFFISNDESRKQNRISFLFELVARTDGLTAAEERDEYGIFCAFNRRLAEDSATTKSEWREIKNAFMTLEEWFDDRSLYHIIGFLIHEGHGVKQIRKESEGCTKSEFADAIRARVFEHVVGVELPADSGDELIREKIRERLDELTYEKQSNHKRIRAVLLLFNIASLIENKKSTVRFQFDSFKTEEWDIEHVRSVASDRLENPKQQAEWLKHSQSVLKLEGDQVALCQMIQDFLDTPKAEIAEEDFGNLYRELVTHFKEDTDENDDSIANLVLLDQATNRSYKNAVFAAKRQRLLSLDRAGIFVPLCTRNVFLKCYSDKVDHLMFWSLSDRTAYRNEMLETLVRFFTHGLED